ncbi:site-specific integrase [Paraburkholderia terrae]|uniref:site-specific integrase n=1 Tax=Paraburkholderia terrae TaxID=311230 RepID=UPI0033653F4E
MKRARALKLTSLRCNMNNSSQPGPWIRRFLIEYLVGERNLAVNTQRSYRDMLVPLLPYLAAKVDKRIDRLTVDDLSPQMVRLFLTHMEEQRHCMVSTRNQRLGGIHAGSFHRRTCTGIRRLVGTDSSDSSQENQ